MRQKGDMQQVPYSRQTNTRIMHHRTKCSHPGEIVPRICTDLDFHGLETLTSSNSETTSKYKNFGHLFELL